MIKFLKRFWLILLFLIAVCVGTAFASDTPVADIVRYLLNFVLWLLAAYMAYSICLMACRDALTEIVWEFFKDNEEDEQEEK